MNYKVWLFIAILLFAISSVVGWAIPDSIAGLLAEDIATLEELAGMLASLPPALIAVIIFFKNSLSLVVSFLLSPILCLTPLLALMVNGWLLGWISATVIEKESLGVLLAGLLPHGVIELPAFFIGEAAALSFGATVTIIFPIILVLKKETRTILLSTVKQDIGHILLTLALFFTVGIFFTIIIVALFQKQTRDLFIANLIVNLKQNLRYLAIALGLLIPAALIEAFITPLFLK